MTPAECEKWVEFGQTLELEAPKPPGKDEAERTNCTCPLFLHPVHPVKLTRLVLALAVRFQIYAPKFAAQLHTILSPYLLSPAFTSPTPPKALYPKIRIYDYPPHTFFRPHYDESTTDALTSLVSKWTLLVYLTGYPDVKGGETVFWTREPNAKGRNGECLEVGLRRGRAVLHRHGGDCLLHEGKEVEVGHKWILRSDVMYSGE